MSVRGELLNKLEEVAVMFGERLSQNTLVVTYFFQIDQPEAHVFSPQVAARTHSGELLSEVPLGTSPRTDLRMGVWHRCALDRARPCHGVS